MKIKTTFEAWKRLVDANCIAKCGMSTDDLPDCPYRDWYDQGVKPPVAAQRAIKYAKES